MRNSKVQIRKKKYYSLYSDLIFCLIKFNVLIKLLDLISFYNCQCFIAVVIGAFVTGLSHIFPFLFLSQRQFQTFLDIIFSKELIKSHIALSTNHSGDEQSLAYRMS